MNSETIENGDTDPGMEENSPAGENGPGLNQGVEHGSPEGSTGSEAGGDSVEGKLDQALREIEELKESWMRERAEFTNFKKRSSQEQLRIKTHVIGNFVKGLLPVLDNLDRVLQVESEDPAVKNFVVGVEMIRGEFRTALEKEGIFPHNPVGESFDPVSMEAIAMEDREGLEKETVLEVYQEGYTMGQEENEKQVLRPARVKVGKPV